MKALYRVYATDGKEIIEETVLETLYDNGDATERAKIRLALKHDLSPDEWDFFVDFVGKTTERN